MKITRRSFLRLLSEITQAVPAVGILRAAQSPQDPTAINQPLTALRARQPARDFLGAVYDRDEYLVDEAVVVDASVPLPVRGGNRLTYVNGKWVAAIIVVDQTTFRYRGVECHLMPGDSISITLDDSCSL
jgi:hypothetical protein